MTELIMKKEYPQFISEGLNNVVSEFKRRSKAIKHMGGKIEFSREIETHDGLELERLNIDHCSLFSPPDQLRISIWQDLVVYFRNCQGSKKGWAYNVSFYGDTESVQPHELVKMFESSISIGDEEHLKNVWEKISPYNE